MHESDTYQAILDEGAEKLLRELIPIVGEERFGPADEVSRKQFDAVTDLDRLKRMYRRIIKAANWEEVLGTP
jgi:hypothetical protein